MVCPLWTEATFKSIALQQYLGLQMVGNPSVSGHLPDGVSLEFHRTCDCNFLPGYAIQSFVNHNQILSPEIRKMTAPGCIRRFRQSAMHAIRAEEFHSFFALHSGMDFVKYPFARKRYPPI